MSFFIVITKVLLYLSNYSFESNAFVPSVSISLKSSNYLSDVTGRNNHYVERKPTTIRVFINERTKEDNYNNDIANDDKYTTVTSSTRFFNRKDFLTSSILFASTLTLSTKAMAKCTDIESCREIGEKKVEQDMVDNPTLKTKSGVRYKVLQPGIDEESKTTVRHDSNIDLIFSISTLSGGYMYSRGFGFEKIDVGNGKLQSDIGLDSLRVQLGRRDVPLGIEEALVGMKKGERRRIELPPRLGFETSDWKPEPTTRRGKTRIVGYKQLLEGNGSTRPAFPAATIWDVEVLRIRN